VAGASQQLLVFVLSHLLLAFLNNASHSITSILQGLAQNNLMASYFCASPKLLDDPYYITEGMSRSFPAHTGCFSGQ
jgi:hypothetical protein